MKKIISFFIFLIVLCIFFLILVPQGSKAFAACDATIAWKNATDNSGVMQIATGEGADIIVSNAKTGKTYYLHGINLSNSVAVLDMDRQGNEDKEIHLPIVGFNNPGSFLFRLYDNKDLSSACKNSLTLVVAGSPVTQDKCTLSQKDTPSEILTGDTIRFLVDQIELGGEYVLRYERLSSGSTYESPQYLSQTVTLVPGANYFIQPMVFNLQFTNPGSYRITAWHKKQNELGKCSGELYPTIKDTSEPENPPPSGDCVDTPLGCLPTDMADFAEKFVSIATGIAGGLAFLLMVFGAYRLIFSGGDPEAVQQGRQVITAAIIGLVIIIFAVFILRLIGITILGLPI